MIKEEVKEMKIYQCELCKNVIICPKPTSIRCCGKEMIELVANTTDGAQEKHVPTHEEKNGMIEVRVGEMMHPMEENHYIEWILLEETNGYQIHYLQPGEEAFATFYSNDAVCVYAYCNLHGLWKKDISK